MDADLNTAPQRIVVSRAEFDALTRALDRPARDDLPRLRALLAAPDVFAKDDDANPCT